MFKTCFSIFAIYKLDCLYLAQIMSVMAIVSVIVADMKMAASAVRGFPSHFVAKARYASPTSPWRVGRDIHRE